MNKEDEDRQMRETRSLLQKAGQRNASLDSRREALRHLISLTHTPSAELKVYAAQNFSRYFKDFPDLEEDVIDSVYDICEDPEAQVRIEGYKAIVALSTEAKKWTRRNTDVLVQLLQSDEPQELAEIKSSLIAHMNLDAAAVIGVMCDHCSLEPDLGNEEREERERLRRIVLQFFSIDAKQCLAAHFRGPKSEPETVFREGLMKAIGKADVQDTEVIVKDLLLPLPSFEPPSQHGDNLLLLLLEKVKLIFSEIKSKPGPVSLLPVKPYLVLMEYVVVERRAAYPGPLLRFYSTALIGKIALQKLDQESQLTVIEKLATALRASEDERLKHQDTPSDELATLRNTVVDACPHIFDNISKMPPHIDIPWEACMCLLDTCQQRRKDQRWVPPPNLVRSIQGLGNRADSAHGKPAQDLIKDVQKFLDDLHIGSNKPTQISKPERPASPNVHKRKHENDIVSFAGTSLQTNNLGTKRRDDRSPASVNESRPESPSTSLQGTGLSVSAPRGPKLINRLGGDVTTGERSSVPEVPPLLRRMSSSDTRPANGNQRGNQQVSTADAVLPTIPGAPPTMLSIKGAASKQLTKEVSPPLPTLMERIRVDPEITDDSHRDASRRRKKRTIAAG